MTTNEKKALTRTFVGDVEDDVLSAFLTSAEHAILRRYHPFGFSETDVVPAEYEELQCELAARRILRRGGEGEISHGENGVNRAYASPNDEDLLGDITPCVKVVF